MPKGLLIDGAPLTSDCVFLIGVRGANHPGIDVNSFSRGGRSGSVTSIPFYRGFAASIELAVKGCSFLDLQTKLDYVMGLLKQESDKEHEQKKLISFIMFDDSLRSVPVTIASVSSDLTPESKTVLNIQISIVTEREYYSGPDETATVRIFNGGGAPVPMPIPMTMANQTQSSLLSLINNGNADSKPTCRVYGDMNGFSLVNTTTGQQLDVTQNLSSTDFVDLDFYNRTAVFNDTVNILDKVSDGWWWIAPGTNEVKLSTTSTSSVARAVFTYHSAFLNV